MLHRGTRKDGSGRDDKAKGKSTFEVFICDDIARNEENKQSFSGGCRSKAGCYCCIFAAVVCVVRVLVVDDDPTWLKILEKMLKKCNYEVINPDMPQTIEHINRLQNIPTRLQNIPTIQSPATDEQRVTVLDLRLNNQKNIQGSKNFACEARITKIQEDRAWYYVLRSKCTSKLYQDSDKLIFVCKDDDNITPNFRYCVNATITDETGSVEAVFFNDSMQEMLNITCEEMVTKHANTANPRFIPHKLNSAVGIPALLHLNLKNDGKIVVNHVTKNEAATEEQPTNAGTSTFTPVTPIPKAPTSKRQLAETQGLEKKFKKS